MNNRRKLVIALGAGALTAPFGSFAQQQGKVWRIGYLSLRSGPNDSDEAFRQGLREQGYVEGRTILIEYRWAAGNRERLREFAADLVRLKVDVIVTAATPAIDAVKNATRTIPIVMAASADPVGTGLVESLARPGGNVTGLTLMSTDLAGKKLQLVHELLPKATRVALLVFGRGSATELYLDQMRSAAQAMGIKLIVQEARQAEDLPETFAAMQREQAQALIMQLSPLTAENSKRIAELAAQHRLPAVYEIRDFVDTGGLVSYGPNVVEMYRRSATYVDKILKGAKPGDLPVEQPTKFELFINGKTAKALGLKIPQSILIMATKVIE